MFRWVALQVDALGQCRNRIAVEATLTDLPRTLDETYRWFSGAASTACESSNIFHPSGLSALHWAAANDCEKVVKFLLEKGALVDSVGYHEGPTPLYFALERGSTNVIDVLLAHGADVNLWGQRKNALVALLESGLARRFEYANVNGGRFIDTIETLLARGVDINGTGPWKPLKRAVETHNEGAVRLLLDRGALIGTATLQMAARQGRREIMTALIDHGANINSSDGYLCVLSEAIRYNTSDVVDLLLEKGADINAKTLDSMPLEVAARLGDRKIVQALLDHGADIHSTSRHGCSLYHAADAGNDDIVELLLKHGAQVDGHAKWRTTPLQAAAHKEYKSIVRVLLYHGACINTVRKSGSALYLAALYGEEQMIQLLAKRGADVDLAIRDASSRKHPQTASRLRQLQTHPNDIWSHLLNDDWSFSLERERIPWKNWKKWQGLLNGCLGASCCLVCVLLTSTMLFTPAFYALLFASTCFYFYGVHNNASQIRSR
ncbi:hypothetical protein D6C92_08266 [Aureobasidium pullulans]|nr:hypothetical protein D6C92_08266 [Aureobasidium pullulans]